MREITLAGTRVADDTRAYLIAEIGNNHQGDLSKAVDLIDMAYLCGASAVKFQKRDNRSLFTQAAYHRPYSGRNSFGPTYGTHREAVELSPADMEAVRDYAQMRGITFFATPFDIPSAEQLAALNVPFFKIASGDLTNIPLIRHVTRYGKPMIISTGGATIEDVDRAVEAILPHTSDLAILQCTSSYPASTKTLNLRVIETYRDRYPECVIGYSGHDAGRSASLVAYGLGARIIEKHVTIDHSWKGTDQAFSLDADELRSLVGGLILAHEALGDGLKRRLPTEHEPMVKMEKSLYAARALPAGHILAEQDVAIKCPGGGLPPYELDTLLGQPLAMPLAEEEALTLAHVRATITA